MNQLAPAPAVPPITRPTLPLVVDLDGTFLKVDALFEMFAAGLFSRPVQTILVLGKLRFGIAAFRRSLSELVQLDVGSFPVRENLLAYLEEQAAAGRDIHLATTADDSVAARVAELYPVFKSASGTEPGINLWGPNKAKKLQELFPGGFVYAGDSPTDLPIWKCAGAAIMVSATRSLKNSVQLAGIPIERSFDETTSRYAMWLSAIRPHQWAKNAIVLAPIILGWRDTTPAAFLTSLIIIAVLCVVVSLTYVINDIADLAYDRKHWSKKRRPFAAGEIPLRDGLIAVGIGLPLACGTALYIAPLAGVCIVFYVIVTLGYSVVGKRIPLFDTFLISLLFTIRVLIGIAAADLRASAWLLTFSMFFFFSIALAKRHTELLRASEKGLQTLEGRGYRAGDESMTLTFGSAASMASILIVVIYLVEEVFARQIYRTPAWLWVTPIAIFLFSCRIWVLAHQGKMTDDPIAFALRDRVSLWLGVLVAIAIALAV